MKLSLDPADLRPLILAIVHEVMAQVEQARSTLGDKGNRLAFSEAEAARLLGMNPWQLRDERVRGRIAASQIVGKRVRYTREDLVAYLQKCRVNEGPCRA
jgi:hypothetical protein